MQCDICDKEAGSLLVCDKCGKHVCKECTSAIGGNVICRDCISKRQDEQCKEKKGLVPPHLKRAFGHWGILAILAFWVLVGAAYLAMQKGPAIIGGSFVPAPPPKNVDISSYRPVCGKDGAVYALEISVSNLGTGPLSLETIVVNGKNAAYEGERSIPAGGSQTYFVGAEDVFGGGFLRSNPPRGAQVLVVTNGGSVSKAFTTNPASCVQK